MIEVEKKFTLTNKEKERLLKGALLVSEKTVEDTYFDTSAFRLTSKDWWLRERNGIFELKKNRYKRTGKTEKNQVDLYDEITDLEEIVKLIEISYDENIEFKDLLKKNNIKPFSTLITNRKTYEKDGFTIVDDATNFDYDIVEIEKEGKDEADSKRVADEIIAYAAGFDIHPTGTVKSKMEVYLLKNNPVHHAALVKTGVYDK